MNYLSAQSISPMVSTREKCNAGCKFCISRTTPGCSGDSTKYGRLDIRHLRKGLQYAQRLGATHAILTGKSEPTLEDKDYLCELVKVAREYVPLVDLHTNGTIIQKLARGDLLKALEAAGLTMVTYSIADWNPSRNEAIMGVEQYTPELIDHAVCLGLLVRCSLVVCKDGVNSAGAVRAYVHAMQGYGAHAVIVREIWRPSPQKYGAVWEYNQENWVDLAEIETGWRELAVKLGGVQEREPLPWGQRVYTYTRDERSTNVTFARCDDAVRGTFLKSIVHKPDGHGYRAWDSNGDILY